MEIVITQRLADNAILLEVDTHLAQTVDLHIDNAVGQTELRNTIFQYTTNLVQGLINSHIVTSFRHVSGKRKSGRTGTDNSYLDAIARSHLRHRDLTTFALVISRKTLQIANGHSRLAHLQMDTLALTLLLLRTDTTTNSR